MLHSLRIAVLGTLLVTLSVSGCAPEAVNNSQADRQMAEKTIEAVLKNYTPQLMALPGVVGTGLGVCDHSPCIKVFIVEMTPALKQKLPESLDGYPVVVEVTGAFRALPREQAQ